MVKNKSTPVTPNLKNVLYSGRPTVKWKNTTSKAAIPRKASNSL